jgi:hypothetical protein
MLHLFLKVEGLSLLKYRKFFAAVFLTAILVLAVVPVGTVLAKEPVIPAKKYDKIVLIHYEKPDNPGKGKGPPSEEEQPKIYDYYEVIGPKWDLTKYEDGILYVIDPDGGPEGSVEQIYLAFESWDAETSAELFNDDYIIDSAADPSLDNPDFENVVCWRGIAPAYIVAMTVIWYVDNDGDGEPSEGDETVDCDIILNTLQKWGIDSDGEGTEYTLKKAFDVRNVMTHEAGHVVGLDDLEEEVYSELTMYAYTSKGETKKISLEEGDILGCQYLYGT